MEENKTKKIISKICFKIFIIVLIGFTALYISEESGYYEFEQHNKKVLTEEKIIQFEKDVENGKNIDINDYIVKEDHKYESKASKFGEKISIEMEKIVVSSLENAFKFLNKILG